MALVHEATQVYPGNRTGEMKIAHYSISYSAGAITKPVNDPLWMLLNGAAISRTTYPLLFALFGTAYGVGDGSTTFNIPNFTEGRIPITKGLTNFTSIAAVGGEINHALTTSEIASHAHSDTLAFAASSHGHTSSATLSSTDDSHAHTMTNALSAGDLQVAIGTSPFTTNNDFGSFAATTSGVSTNHAHNGSWSLNNATSTIAKGGSVSNAGSGNSHNNMQPYIVIGGWLVKFG